MHHDADGWEVTRAHRRRVARVDRHDADPRASRLEPGQGDGLDPRTSLGARRDDEVPRAVRHHPVDKVHPHLAHPARHDERHVRRERRRRCVDTHSSSSDVVVLDHDLPHVHAARHVRHRIVEAAQRERAVDRHRLRRQTRHRRHELRDLVGVRVNEIIEVDGVVRDVF